MSWSCSVNPSMITGTSSSSSILAADFSRGVDRSGNNNRGTIISNKHRLKLAVIFHVIAVLLMAFRLSVALYVLIGVRPPRFLQRLRIPPTRTWEFVWLFGNAITCLVGLLATWRWRGSFVRFYAFGSFFCGLLPALYAAVYDVSPDLMQYWETRQTKLSFQGVPLVLLWSMFLAAAVQLHLYAVYFAWSLLSAWKQRANAARLKTT